MKGIKATTQDQPSGGWRNTNVSVEGNRRNSVEDSHRTGLEGKGKLDKTFTSDTYSGPVKGSPKTGGPPSVKSKDAQRKKFMRDNPPPVKYADKKKKKSKNKSIYT